MQSPRVPPVGNAAQVNFNANNRAKPTKRAKRIVRLPLLDAYVGRRNCTHSTLAWNRDDGTMTVEDGKLPIPRLAREVSLKECNHLEVPATSLVGLISAHMNVVFNKGCRPAYLCCDLG